MATITTRGGTRRRVVWAGVLAGGAVGAALWLGPGQHAAQAARGARLFDGSEPLVATLSGHTTPLPPDTARCIQCHTGPTTTTSTTSAQPLPGPVLDRRHLRDALPRRGGPPIAYELATFCRAVRSGVDPASVVLPRTMPRFDIDDARCEALWRYLTEAPT